MATPRRIKNSPSRSTLLPRRNAARPGMGGSNGLPKINGQGGGFWQGLPGSGGENDGGLSHRLKVLMSEKAAEAQGGGGQGGNGNYVPGIGSILHKMGLGTGGGLGTGFGFDQQQKLIVGQELQRIREYMAQHQLEHNAKDQLHFQPGMGIGGTLASWERQLGMPVDQVGQIGATQDQQDMFRKALQFQNNGWGGGGGGWGGGGGGGGHNGGGGNGGGGPGPQDSPGNKHQAGMMPYQPPPQYYSPGNPHDPAQGFSGQPAQSPQQAAMAQAYGAPTSPVQAGAGFGMPPGMPPPQYQPPPQAMGVPQYGAPAQMAPPGPPQGLMPPFAQGSSGAGTPGGDTTPATYGPTQQLQFQTPQLPGWNQFTHGYYGELPQQPGFLTGAGETQWQAIMNQVRNGMAGLQGQYGQIQPQLAQQGLRMQNDYAQAHEATAEDLAARGIFDSGAARETFQQQQAQANRSIQDLLAAGQGQVGDLYGQAGNLFDTAQAELLNLIQQQAAQQATAANAPYHRNNKKPTPKRNKKGK